MKKSTHAILISIIGLLLLITTFAQLQLATSVGSVNRELTPRSSGSEYGLLPTENIPTGTINITQEETEVVIKIEDIVNMTTLENGTIPLHRWEIFLEDAWHNITGINPLHLIELIKFGYARTVRFWSATEANRTLDVGELIMHDSDYYKDAVSNATILALAVDDQWFGVFDESYGAAVLIGEEFTEEMMIKDVHKISLETEWVVEITLDGVKVGEISRLNRTDEFLNYTTYTWGYFDNKSSTSWGPNECTGYTVKSIVTLYNTGDCLCFPPKEGNYTVSFIAIDGWYGGNKKYGKLGIEEGFTGYEINDPAIPLENQGKLAILTDKINDAPIDYRRGAYQFVAPGLHKGNYIGQVVEMRILTIPEETTTTTTTTTPTTTPKIAGYGFEILLGCFTLAVAVIIFRRSRR